MKTPTRLELHRNTRLAEALAAAGGPTKRAGRTLQIIHHAGDSGCGQLQGAPPNQQPLDSQVLNLDEVMKGSEAANPRLEARDIVVVSESDVVYVVGNVVSPQALVLQPAMTLTQAIALAGGVLRATRTDRIRVIRQVAGSAQKQLVVSLKAIGKHQAMDLVLEANDIIDVPARHHGWSGGDPICVIAVQLPIRVID